MIGERLKTGTGTILIVDEQPEDLLSLGALLSDCGYLVRPECNGEAALETASRLVPDLILLEAHLSGIGGFQLCSQLKQSLSTTHIPVIFVSKPRELSDRVRAFAVGGVDFIGKPYVGEEVIARVQLHLDLQRAIRSLKKENEQLQQEINARIKTQALLQRHSQQNTSHSAVDSLTGRATRRRLKEHLAQEWRRLARDNASLSLLIADIDYFKIYNDIYDYQTGDSCLQQIAQALLQVVKRPADLVSYYGSDEFAICLPNTDAEGATRVAEYIRAKVDSLRLAHPQSPKSNYLTLSQGIATLIPQTSSSYLRLISLAEQAVMQAKKQGRDRIVVRVD